MNDDFKFWVSIAALILVPINLLILACVGLGDAGCQRASNIMQRDYQFSALSGCFLKDDNGRFFPADNFHQIDVTK